METDAAVASDLGQNAAVVAAAEVTSRVTIPTCNIAELTTSLTQCTLDSVADSIADAVTGAAAGVTGAAAAAAAGVTSAAAGAAAAAAGSIEGFSGTEGFDFRRLEGLDSMLSGLTEAPCDCAKEFMEGLLDCTALRGQAIDSCPAGCSCATQNRDCKLGSTWVKSECSASCGTGVVRFSRTIEQLPRGNGQCNLDNLVRFAKCEGSCDTNTDVCANGLHDFGEADVDCGGDCDACEEGRSCFTDSDCASGLSCLLPSSHDVALFGSQTPVCALVEKPTEIFTEAVYVRSVVRLVGGMLKGFSKAHFLAGIAKGLGVAWSSDLAFVTRVKLDWNGPVPVVVVYYVVDVNVLLPPEQEEQSSLVRRLADDDAAAAEAQAMLANSQSAIDTAVMVELGPSMPTLESAESDPNEIIISTPTTRTEAAVVDSGSGSDSSSGGTNSGTNSGSSNSGGTNSGSSSTSTTTGDVEVEGDGLLFGIVGGVAALLIIGIVVLVVVVTKKRSSRGGSGGDKQAAGPTSFSNPIHGRHDNEV